MSTDQAAKFVHQFIRLINTFLQPIIEQKLTLSTGKAVGEAVRGWLTRHS